LEVYQFIITRTHLTAGLRKQSSEKQATGQALSALIPKTKTGHQTDTSHGRPPDRKAEQGLQNRKQSLRQVFG